MKENYKEIVGYGGLYSVSNTGNVYSSRKGDLMVPNANPRGYLKITLCLGGKQKKFFMHRLVAQAHIPNPDGLNCVMHLDDDPSNNSIDNLKWATHTENMQDAWTKGRLKKPPHKTGESCGKSKLNKTQVTEIRNDYVPYVVTMKMLAENYSVSESTIKDIIYRKNWKLN